MIDENEIRRWIARLETEESSWANYTKLAALYTVLDRQRAGGDRPAVLATPVPQADSMFHEGSEFLQAVSSCPAEKAWTIMDELMNILAATNPRAYASVLRKLDSA